MSRAAETAAYARPMDHEAEPIVAEPIVAEPIVAEPIVEGDGEVPGPDRDLATLEALESELASLEGELARVERTDPPVVEPPA